MEEKILILGASIAGLFLAKELRRENYRGQITLIDRESHLPYDTLPLSKEWMQNLDEINPPTFHEQAYYDDNKINLKLNTEVTHFDPSNKKVYTRSGEVLDYDKLVLALGSGIRKLKVPGREAEGIFYLRNFNDALAIKNRARLVKNVAIIGAGFIGLELASSLRQVGLNVEIIERSARPLQAVFGEEVADYFTRMHESHGVNILTGEEVKQFTKDERGQVSSVVTLSGKIIPCEMAIVGIGVIPNTEILPSELKVDKGIVVNQYGETNLTDVYALGDCTVWPYKNEEIHIEHWEHAYHHGKNLARNLIEKQSQAYRVRPYFWTDEYDQTFEYLGHAPSWHKTILRGSLQERQFTVAYVDKNNYPLAILFANEGDKRNEVTAFLDKNKAINEEKFKDLSINLKNQ